MRFDKGHNGIHIGRIAQRMGKGDCFGFVGIGRFELDHVEIEISQAAVDKNGNQAVL